MGKFDSHDLSRPISIPLATRLWTRARIFIGRRFSPRGALRWACLWRRIELWMHPRRRWRLTILMKRLLPPGVTRREAYRLALASRAVRRVGGHTFSPVSRRSRKWLLETLRPEGLEHLEAVRQAGRGAIVLSTHSGMNAWVGPVLLGLGYPVRLMQRTSISAEKYLLFRDNGWIDRVLPYPDPANSGPHLKRLLEFVRQGQWVQHVATARRPTAGLSGDFLGRQISASPAAWALARLSGAPALPAFVLADADLRPRLVVGEPLTVAADGPAPAAVEKAFLAYLKFVTDRLAAEPWNVSLLDWWMHGSAQ